MPDVIAKPGDYVTVRVQLLTMDDFVKSLPAVDFVNQAQVKWVGDTVRLTDYRLVGGQMVLTFEPDPPYGVNSEFTMTGQVKPLAFGSFVGVYLDLPLTDFFKNERTIRIYFDGHHQPTFGINIGDQFAPVYIISSDGVRLRIVYDGGKDTGGTTILRTATLYSGDPSVLYSLSDMYDYSLPYKVPGYYQAFAIDDVSPFRSLERSMAGGGTYDVARIGAEVAYTVANEKLGLPNVVMEDPAQGGSDLYTPDHKIVIEARMLSRTSGESGQQLVDDITTQLNQMVGRLHSDFRYYKSPTVGYAVFTYAVDKNTIRTIVLEVLPP